MLLVSIATQTMLSAKDDATCPVVKLEAVRMPDLNVPRVGHSVFVVNGEPTVVGGHTTSFVPTATAEYFSDGEWHLMQTAYPHDEGFSVPLSSGKVLIGGGHAETLGIGHIYSVEMYDPASHSFKGFGCLDTKRCFANAAEIDSGRVVVSGNWHHDIHDIELFDGEKFFHSVKPAAQKRARPFVLRIAEDDALIFGSTDDHGEPFDTIVVDRLKGEPFLVPLFDEWQPPISLVETDSRNYRVEDEGQDSYTYLIPVMNKEGQIALCRIAGTQFSLLPTKGSIPTDCNGRHINYQSWLGIDRQAGCAYLYGIGDNDGQLYMLAIDITKTPADLTLFYTEPTGHPVYSHPVLLPDGNLLFTGGMGICPDFTVDNFTPHATVLLLPVGHHDARQLASTEAKHLTWLWAVVALLTIACLVVLLWRHRKTKTAGEAKTNVTVVNTDTTDEALMQRICQLMEEERPYLNSELKIADIASRLGTNTSYVSACINRQKGYTFNQFVNGYRIHYAKKLLKGSPDKKIFEVWAVSGFANETSFFRTFKALTGMTPTEWKATID